MTRSTLRASACSAVCWGRGGDFCSLTRVASMMCAVACESPRAECRVHSPCCDPPAGLLTEHTGVQADVGMTIEKEVRKGRAVGEGLHSCVEVAGVAEVAQALETGKLGRRGRACACGCRLGLVVVRVILKDVAGRAHCWAFRRAAKGSRRGGAGGDGGCGAWVVPRCQLGWVDFLLAQIAPGAPVAHGQKHRVVCALEGRDGGGGRGRGGGENCAARAVLVGHKEETAMSGPTCSPNLEMEMTKVGRRALVSL